MITQARLQWTAYFIFIVIIMIMPEFLDEFWLNRLSKYLIYGMLGIAISLSWGYAGILNLGQGLFFGLGAYMLAMSLKLASDTSMQQGADKAIPDFMFFNAEPDAISELCCIVKGSWLWLPFESQWFGVFMGLLLPAIVAFLLSYIVGRARISGVYVAIITLALALLVRLLVVDAQPLTNGFNSLTDLGWFTAFGIEFDPYLTSTYYLVATSLTVVLISTRWLVSTKAGLILQAMRENETRSRYLGYNVAQYQVFFFTVSGVIAGIAGMLFVIATEFASPVFMSINFSITMVVWAAVGGRASLLGACIGAILLNTIEATVSENELFVEAWQLIIGALFIIVVLFLPRGLAGLTQSLANKIFFSKQIKSEAYSK